jgi:hypothetical protein
MCRTSVLAKGQNLGAGAIHLPRAVEIPKGEGRLWRPKSKKKDTMQVVSFFLQRTVKNDIFSKKQKRRNAAKPNRNPAQRL